MLASPLGPFHREQGFELLLLPGTKQPTPPELSRSPELSRLTACEVEVLRMMARGLSNPEMAGELLVSETTVKTHVAHVSPSSGCETECRRWSAYESGAVSPGGAD